MLKVENACLWFHIKNF